MVVIHKWNIGAETGMPMPLSMIRALHMEEAEDGTFWVWGLVDKENKTSRQVMVVGTGWEYDHEFWEYVMTLRCGRFVWHLMQSQHVVYHERV